MCLDSHKSISTYVFPQLHGTEKDDLCYLESDLRSSESVGGVRVCVCVCSGGVYVDKHDTIIPLCYVLACVWMQVCVKRIPDPQCMCEGAT